MKINSLRLTNFTVNIRHDFFGALFVALEPGVHQTLYYSVAASSNCLVTDTFVTDTWFTIPTAETRGIQRSVSCEIHAGVLVCI